MDRKEKRPYKVFQIGGRSFPIYLEYDEETGESYPDYPDFEECPEYTEEGRPFATAGQESCPQAGPRLSRCTKHGRLTGPIWMITKPTGPIGRPGLNITII